MSEIERGPHGYCLECEARIETAEHMETVVVCSACVDVRPNETIRETPFEVGPLGVSPIGLLSEQTYVVEYSGGYWSENQGRVRHITDAQLYSLKELAQYKVDELDSDSCAIKPVWIGWETDR